MRQIKFRAWDKEKKHWMSASEIDYGVSKEGFCGTFILGGLGRYGYDILQFTGLLDKNGKEIYEGDVVKHIPSAFDNREAQGEIYWFNGHQRFAMKKDGSEHYLDSLNIYEIIGNIYESPNLLK